MSTSAWFTETIRMFEEAHTTWGTLHKACTDSYKEYIKKDAECDCEQAECETINCVWESCNYNNCEDIYNKCWARCEGEYKRTNEAKECLEKDRKIDWSATEKIECYVNVLLEEPDNATLLSVCGKTDCFNEYREKMYKTCNTICEEVDYVNTRHDILVHGVGLHDYDTDDERLKHHHRHHRRDHRAASHSGRNTSQLHDAVHGRYEHVDHSVTDHKGRHADIDATIRPEGDEWVRTKHRHETDESLEKRCTSHLDLDYQVPPCCTPCLVRPSHPCEKSEDDDYLQGCNPHHDKSYTCLMYGQHNFLSGESVQDLDKPTLTGENAPQVINDCHKKGDNKDHARFYAYNLCTCLECTLAPRADPATCTAKKYCSNYNFPEFLVDGQMYNYENWAQFLVNAKLYDYGRHRVAPMVAVSPDPPTQLPASTAPPTQLPASTASPALP